MLGAYKGIAVVDGYSAYKTLARASPELSLAYCWAHVRRKYVQAAKFYPEETVEILDLLGKLFEVDASVPNPERLKGDAHVDALALRAKVRDEQLRPVIATIREWALNQRALKGSALRKAVDYMLGLWKGLVLFLDDPRIPLTNNIVNAARGINDAMPRPGLCRVEMGPACFLRHGERLENLADAA